VAVLLSACGGARSDFYSAANSNVKSTSALVYASIPDEGLIYGFTWLSFETQLQLNSSGVEGICSDKAGDVFVPTGPVVYEYAHGATTPEATLENTFEGVACAVDPSSGNVAVMNYPNRKGSVTVNIFTRAKGSPQSYSLANFAHLMFGGYDDSGNLFVDGFGPGSRGVLLSELSSGRKKFVHIVLRKYIGYAGGVAWDGNYLAIADGTGAANSPIYRFAISGNQAKLQGSLTLDESCGVRQFAIYKNTVVAASGCTTDADLGYWKYPKGGSPVAASGNWGDNLAYGVAISP
jgi:hypothetical protein